MSWALLQALLGFLLATAPEQLYRAYPAEYGSFSAASRAEYAAKRLAGSIQSLYDRN